MVVISPAEFRANQKKFFEIAEKETVIVARKNKKPLIIKPWEEEDVPTREELMAIQEGLNDIKEGRITFVNPTDIWVNIE